MNETEDLEMQPQRPTRVNFKESGSEKQEDEKEVDEELPVVCRHGATDQQRREDLENAIAWLRKELQAMRSQDRSLAKQLIGLRTKIQTILKGENDESFDSDEVDQVDSRTA